MTEEVLATLDIGSNSAHLLVAEVLPAAHIRRLGTRKTTLRLAEPVARDGRFGPTVRHRVVTAVDDLAVHARKRGAGGLVVVATDAFRHAEDGPELRATLSDQLGLRVRVLEGLEEAQLGFRGMAAALRVDGPMLGIDLGGGSLELAYGIEGRLVAGASLPLGSARVSTRFAHDPPWLVERSALHAEAVEHLFRAAPDLLGAAGGVAPPAAGTAGTIRDLGRLGLALAAGTELERVRGLVVTREQLEVALAQLVALPARERIDLPGVSGSRVDILPAGGIVILAAMEALGLEQLVLCDWGLREGAVLDALTDESVVAREDFVPL